MTKSVPADESSLCLQLAYPQGVIRLHHQLCLAVLSDLLVHEFNNALTGFSGYAQMALSLRKEEVYFKAAQAFSDGASSLHELVKNVTSFGRGNIFDLKPFDPAHGIMLINTVLESHLTKRNITILFEKHSIHAARGNPFLIGLVTLTYILDVRDRLIASSESARIHFGLKEDKDRIQLFCSDSASEVFTMDLTAPADKVSLAGSSNLHQILAPIALTAIAKVLQGKVKILPKPHPGLLLEIPTLPH